MSLSIHSDSRTYFVIPLYRISSSRKIYYVICARGKKKKKTACRRATAEGMRQARFWHWTWATGRAHSQVVPCAVDTRSHRENKRSVCIYVYNINSHVGARACVCLSGFLYYISALHPHIKTTLRRAKPFSFFSSIFVILFHTLSYNFLLVFFHVSKKQKKF